MAKLIYLSSEVEGHIKHVAAPNRHRQRGWPDGFENQIRVTANGSCVRCGPSDGQSIEATKEKQLGDVLPHQPEHKSLMSDIL